MNFFFSAPEQPKFKGRPRTTLFSFLNNDLQRCGYEGMKSIDNLNQLRSEAANKEQWKQRVERMKEIEIERVSLL
jgi:hypothetical protein